MATLAEILTAVKALIKSYNENTAEMSAGNFLLEDDEYMGYAKAGVMYKIKASLLSTKMAVVQIIDNLTSTDADKALSAKQGKILKDIVDDNEDRIDNIIAESGTSDTEVVDARFSPVTGVTHSVLTDRITASEQAAQALHEFDLVGLTYSYDISVDANGDPILTYEEKV
jgi:hypothetical protein